MSKPKQTTSKGGNPAWKPGMESPNPSGRAIAKASPGKPLGSDGVAIFSGLISSNERDPNLNGRQRWTTFDNICLNFAIVASAIRLWTDLGAGAKLHVEPNKRGGKDAQRAADLVQEAVLDAQMSKPFSSIMRRQLMAKFRGFAMHEVLLRRRSDGKIVVGDMQHRPQWTVYRWLRDDEQSPWNGIEQMTLTNRYEVPRERLLYSVDDTLSDSPAGTGLLRHLAEISRVRDVFHRLEGIGYQTDLGGMPIGRAPMSQLRDMAISSGVANDDETAIKNFISSQLQPLVDILQSHNKRHDQYLMLDSMPYLSKGEQQTPSSIFQYSFDVVRTAMTAAPHIATALGRLDREAARIMNAEFLLLGGEDSGGAYSMHSDKTAMFGLSVSAATDGVCSDIKRDVATRIVAINGMDPETCTPDIVAEPIATTSVQDACRSLMMLTQAGLHPEDPAINEVRERLSLSPAPKVDLTEWLLPRGGALVPELNSAGKPEGPQIDVKPGALATIEAPGVTPTAADPGKPGNVNAETKKP